MANNKLEDVDALREKKAFEQSERDTKMSEKIQSDNR